jgi:phosphoglycolate phosphatase
VARLLAFDLDGTLVDSSRDIAAAVNATLARVAPGTAAIPLDAILSYVGEGARLLIERSLGHAELDLRPDDVLAVYLECYREHLLDTTYLYPGVAEALGALEGTTLAVLTNKPGDFSRSISRLGVAPRFLFGSGARATCPRASPTRTGSCASWPTSAPPRGRRGWWATPPPTWARPAPRGRGRRA